MKKRKVDSRTLYVLIVLIIAVLNPLYAQTIKTNKDRCLSLAVTGQIAPAEPSRGYTTTWNGKPKMAIGIGGINYNLMIGKPVFGWANGERATMGVATVGIGDRQRSSWIVYSSIGNEVTIKSGEARGKKGLVIGKWGGYALIRFDEDILDQLTIGDQLQAKTRGVGLEIEGFEDVYPHSIDPEILEAILTKKSASRLEVPVVKVIPGEIVGNGHGHGSLYGHWNIQTCYPPDIEKYGLDELRFADLVLLKDIQTDFGMGYYEGGATLGVVCAGPSDVPGQGVGVTPILSTRTKKLTTRIDTDANIGKYLGFDVPPPPPAGKYSAAPPPPPVRSRGVTGLKTNKDKLIEIGVQAVVQPASSRGYSTTYTGDPKVGIGMASINYTVSIGDPTYGWASADHVEPDVTVQGRDRPRASDCAIAILGCIGNKARVISGEAAGEEGIYLGRHAGSDDLVWFPKEVKEKMTINDKIHVNAKGVGLKIEGFEDVRLNKISPEALENLGIEVNNDKLVVPVVMEIPGHIMGSGVGSNFVEANDYDIQTTCPETVEKYNLKKLRLGDLVAIRDHYNCYGTGRYEGAVTIGVCIHGWSDYAGHGPGVNSIIAALPGKIDVKIDPDANIGYALGILKK